MSKFQPILSELKSLQAQFTKVTNHIWGLKRSYLILLRQGMKEDDFLPRRTKSLEEQASQEFQKLYSKLQHIIQNHFDDEFFLLDSDSDVEAIRMIILSMRYIHNAFAGEPPVGETLARLNAALPFSVS